MIANPLENITETDYTAFYFNKFNTTSIDYEIVVSDDLGKRSYLDWKDPQSNDYYGPIQRYDVDQYHEKILKKFATRLNPEAPKYKLDIVKLDLPREGPQHDKRPKTNEPDFYNPYVFLAFVIALFG